jgi:serine/threonine-protein kinase
VTGSAADVFISYKAEDRARLQPLVAALEAEGFSIWWDAHIGGGTNWRQDIQEHLDAAKCVIVAWSKRSIGPEGEFVRDEAVRAKRHHTYLPVRIDDVEPPLGFGEVQAFSLKNWKGDRSDPRLAAVIDAVRERITGEHVEHHAENHQQPRISRRTAVAGGIGIGIGAIAVVGTGGWLLLKPGAADAKRIAVLPFANLSGDEAQSYFADGISEELRAALARIGLQVIGRNSCDAVKHLDIKEAAAKLDVGNLLTGSVRRSPETIRVNAQLVSGKDGVERWAQTYDRAPGDAIKIQTEIAENVAHALSIELGRAGRAALSLGGTADIVAQDLVLQARKLRQEDSSAEARRKGVTLADGAIARDPNYADAYVERAICLSRLAQNYPASAADAASQLQLANESARRALSIAPELGSVHAVLADIDRGRLNFPRSLEHAKRALALSPDDPDVLAVATTVLPYLDEGPSAMRLVDRFIRLDPLSATAYRRKAAVLYGLRHYAQSVEAGRKALEFSPDGYGARAWIGGSLLLMGRSREAQAEFSAIPAGDFFRLFGEALVAARSGDRAGAERIMSQIRRQHGSAVSFQYAAVRAQLGQIDQAFAELDNAVVAKDSGLIYLKSDPFIDPIRGDPRYAALLRKLQFS